MRLQYFKDSEFRTFKNQMDRRLLVMADVLRHIWGRPVMISPASGALVRNSGRSWHNVSLRGWCYAMDVMPEGVENVSDAERFHYEAMAIGFTGIGYYPHWYINGNEQRPGFHLDTRTDREMGDPALWGAVKRGNIFGEQSYVDISVAFEMGPCEFMED